MFRSKHYILLTLDAIADIRTSRVWHDRKELDDLHKAGAKVSRLTQLQTPECSSGTCQYFVCGSGKVARGVKDILTAIIKEARGVDDAEAAALFEKATVGRFATDIFE